MKVEGKRKVEKYVDDRPPAEVKETCRVGLDEMGRNEEIKNGLHHKKNVRESEKELSNNIQQSARGPAQGSA